MMGTWLPETCWATIRREIKIQKVSSSWFFLSTLNYDARSTTHRIYHLLCSEQSTNGHCLQSKWPTVRPQTLNTISFDAILPSTLRCPKQLPFHVYQLKFFEHLLCFPGALDVPPIEQIFFSIIVIVKLCQELGFVTDTASYIQWPFWTSTIQSSHVAFVSDPGRRGVCGVVLRPLDWLIAGSNPAWSKGILCFADRASRYNLSN